jgi:hypothetical protein
MLKGGCVCGTVRFAVDAPLADAGWCHCTRCQHRTGTPASPAGLCAPGSFRLTQGEDAVTEWVPDGGFVKAFCSRCGGHLYSRSPDGWDVVGLRLGAVDGDPGIRPRWHQFTADASPWHPVPDDGLPRYPGRRP